MEYSKAMDRPSLHPSIQIMECVFKDNGRVIAVHAKRARGLMAKHLIQKLSISQDVRAIIEHMKVFQSEGYQYDEKTSSNTQFVFNRVGKYKAPVEELEESNGPARKKPKAK